MTNADIANLRRYGDEIGREIDDFLARSVLGARQILVTDPQNAFARETVESFARYLASGVLESNFAPFMLGYFLTEEEKGGRS